MSAGCKVCDDRVLRTAVDELLDQKETFSFISRVMTARGFPVSANVASSHASHRYLYAAPEATKVEQRDIAKLIQQKTGDAIAEMSVPDLLDKDNQAAIANALKAQVIIDKRAAAQKKIGTGEALLSILAALSAGVPLPQLEDGLVIDSTAVEVPVEAED